MIKKKYNQDINFLVFVSFQGEATHLMNKKVRRFEGRMV